MVEHHLSSVLPPEAPKPLPEASCPVRYPVAAEEYQISVCLRRLNHYYDAGEFRKQVLFDIGFDLWPGEISIMTGPSGSGKTTLLSLIGALRSVQEGSVQIQGHELRGLSNRERVDVRRNIGFIFQAHNLFESLTGLQNVRMALELRPYKRHEKQQLARDILVKLGLAHRLHAKPHAMSGGERQRVAIARALVNRPKLILADEPTAALDPATTRDVVTLLHHCAKAERVTVIMVTHDNRLLDVADRIMNLVDGRIVSNVVVEASVTICEFLVQCPVFSRLTPSVLSSMADKMTHERYPADTVILRQGEEGDKFYVVRQGTVAIRSGDGPLEHVLAVLGQGEVFGEAALLTGYPRNATGQAIEDVALYVLGQDDFRAALDASMTFKPKFPWQNRRRVQ